MHQVVVILVAWQGVCVVWVLGIVLRARAVQAALRCIPGWGDYDGTALRCYIADFTCD